MIRGLAERGSDVRLTTREAFEKLAALSRSDTVFVPSAEEAVDPGPLVTVVSSQALVERRSIRQLLIYRLSGALSVTFVTDCETDAKAFQKADVIAELGYRVEVWRDGAEVRRQGDTAQERAMLWDASVIRGYAIAGDDGHLGTVSDLFFDDTSWKMRWLVVDTGHWLPGRQVLLPISALDHPDPIKREFSVKLTRQQIKRSPDVEKDLPVSRQVENDLYDYYGWDPYWTNGYFGGGAIAAPFVPPLFHNGSVLRDPGTVDPSKKIGDPHLRSIDALTGYHVHATDGYIGHIEDFLLSDSDWTFRYIKIDTKNWWPGRRVLISPRSVRNIDWTQRLIELDVSRKKVQESPPYDPSVTVDGAYEGSFLTYYGIRWAQP